MYALLQLNNLGHEDGNLPDLRITYRTRVYSDTHPDITHAYAVDVTYGHPSRSYVIVSISTDVDEGSVDSFVVTVNGLTMANPMWRPLLLDEIVVKQLTNFIIVVIVSPEGFRLEIDLTSSIYVRLDPRFENKVLLHRAIIIH